MKSKTSISISKPLYDKAKAHAKSQRRTFSGQVETWIEEKLSTTKKKGAK